MLAQRTIRVAIADDHPIVRTGLEQVVGEVEDMVVVGSVGTGEELLQVMANHRCTVAVLDLAMPGAG